MNTWRKRANWPTLQRPADRRRNAVRRGAAGDILSVPARHAGNPADVVVAAKPVASAFRWDSSWRTTSGGGHQAGDARNHVWRRSAGVPRGAGILDILDELLRTSRRWADYFHVVLNELARKHSFVKEVRDSA